MDLLEPGCFLVWNTALLTEYRNRLGSMYLSAVARQALSVSLGKRYKLRGTLQGVVNRDIKLENTLLDGSKRPLLKICDFGYSKNDKDSVPKSKVGTPGYTGVCLWFLSLPACPAL